MHPLTYPRPPIAFYIFSPKLLASSVNHHGSFHPIWSSIDLFFFSYVYRPIIAFKIHQQPIRQRRSTGDPPRGFRKVTFLSTSIN